MRENVCAIALQLRGRYADQLHSELTKLGGNATGGRGLILGRG